MEWDSEHLGQGQALLLISREILGGGGAFNLAELQFLHPLNGNNIWSPITRGEI